MARVAVNPELIRWAIRRAAAEDWIEKRFPMVTKWLGNETRPTLKQLEQFAKATSTPIGYFFLPAPPEIKLPIPHYRTIGDTRAAKPSVNLLDTIFTMQRRQAWMREYLMDLGHEPLPFVGSCELSSHPRDVAQNIRNTLGLQNGWASVCRSWTEALQFLLGKIEEIGILVVRNGIVGNNTHRKLDVNEFRGFVLVDAYAPLLFINGADGKAAQMFTVAHELAHIWYGQSAAFDLSGLQSSVQRIEQACNQTAAEFLVPEDEMRAAWHGVKDSRDRFDQLARRFKVSSIVTARRALDLQLITKSEFFDFYHEWLKNDRDREDEARGNFYRNQNFRVGRRFAEAVYTSVKEGRLLYTEAYRLTGLSGDAFVKYGKYLGLRCSHGPVHPTRPIPPNHSFRTGCQCFYPRTQDLLCF